MTSVNIEELRKRFPTENIAPYGSCIVVPGIEFDPDWEHYLGEQGYKCFFIDLNKKPVTLVRLKKEDKAESEKEVYQPSQPPLRWQDPERRWKPEEDELIITLWNRKKKRFEIHAELHKKFPDRSINAVKCRVTRLINAGKIHPRWHVGDHKKKAEKADQATSEPEPTPIEESEVTRLLKEIRDLLQEETVFFEAYCPKCRDRHTVEDSNVWSVCPVCGGPLIIWNVQVFEEGETSK